MSNGCRCHVSLWGGAFSTCSWTKMWLNERYRWTREREVEHKKSNQSCVWVITLVRFLIAHCQVGRHCCHTISSRRPWSKTRSGYGILAISGAIGLHNWIKNVELLQLSGEDEDATSWRLMAFMLQKEDFRSACFFGGSVFICSRSDWTVDSNRLQVQLWEWHALASTIESHTERYPSPS